MRFIKLQNSHPTLSFQILESPVASSGFEDAVSELELCMSGSLHGVLEGSCYNRTWFIHSTFAQALERLLLIRLLVTAEPKIPRSLEELPSSIDAILTDLTIDETFQKRYKKFHESARKGDRGKTAQFWLLYIHLVKYEIMAHIAIQKNDLSMLFHCWERFLPMCFMMTKVH